ncbi:4Fe-4S dicluster domain-containing protein [Siccirubricoccus sp. G192]|uniref:4Fe-4S dicluster domain-containing protein n=1 Tax=Siccirubricoccus sp. G192 TaxID=2849651 RepID=UPI001C2BB1DA|nr:4Fe-4S dicluster domain-containing protein [Siccirubricoccus sp. G192]MBV1799936.1 4Fe-4S dicluster domain-containing protein [Siccirubricoccus sp. G192]
MTAERRDGRPAPLDEPPLPWTLPPPDRRSVLRAAGASLALAAAAGCDPGPEEFGDPLYARPRGVAAEERRYATVLELEGIGRGVLARTRAGHPVKIEGNPAHPGSLGATDVFLEAAVLSLHDPARSRHIRQGGRIPRAAPAPEAALAALAAATPGGEGLRLLTGPIASPTTARLIAAVLAAHPGARWHQWSPLAEDAALAGALLAFGEPVATLHDLSRAATVLALGADLLGEGPAQLRHARDWSAARAAGRASGRLPVLIVAESTPSLTGAKADRRLALRPEGIEALVRAVAAELGVIPAGAGHPDAAPIAAALRQAGPAALVAAGRGQAPAVHALAQAMNAALGAIGGTVRHLAPVMARPEECGASLQALAAAMVAGEVRGLLILDANPAYDAPAGLDFAALLARVPVSVHAGLHVDETALLSAWHLPLKHPLESWGDARAPDGTAAIRQPACLPLVPAARSAEEILASLAGVAPDGETLVRGTWNLGEAEWLAALEAGVLPGTAAPARPVRPRAGFDPGPPAPAATGLVALFAPDPHLRGGEFAPNAWLQELPRPITKQAWGNAALLAPADATALGLADGDEVEFSLRGRAVRAPVLVMPGQAAGVVTLPLGGGRLVAGGVPGRTGFDAYRLRPADAPWVVPGLVLRPTGGRGGVITTAHHHALEGREPPVRSVVPGEAIPPLPPPRSLYPDWEYPGQAWGMAVDLDACIGCNACVIACQAENNTPVVGPEEVARGREMHWLRVDRYAEADGRAAFQPVPCMHCEKAPCEVVCPVNATVHDNEGLNLMIYPRCIGTRTCSNNCPYKVRRFNWFGYARQEGAVAVRNPDVPLRPRGVIEKCTYCQHRIAAARTEAGMQGRPIRDGEVETACQRACPTRAITFGDVNDPDTAVSRAKREGRNYALLGGLDTRPRTTYLARVAAPQDAPGGAGAAGLPPGDAG